MNDGIPKGWSIANLGDVFDVLDHLRKPVNAAERAGRLGEIPYYGATGQVGWINGYLFDEELILLGEDGAPFLESGKPKAYVIRGRSWVNNHAHVLRAPSSTPTSWWKHQLDTVAYSPFVSGTTRLKLPQGPMRRIPLLVPPVAEQHRLAEVVDSYLTRLDDAVASLERAQAKLKAYRASVLKAAVEGRLVPTEADLARAGKRDYEPANVLLARILKERRRRWEETELARLKAAGKTPKDDKWKAKYEEPALSKSARLPELPEGWAWTRISLVGDVQLGRQRAPAHHQGKHMRPYLRVANVFEDRIDTSDVMMMNFTPQEFETYRLRFGDVLLNEGQSPHLIGRPAMYRDEVPGACFQNTLIRFRTTSGVEPRFALIVFRAQLHARRYMRIAQITTNIAHLGSGRFGEIEFPLPPVEEQKRIADEAERLLSIANSVDSSLAHQQTRSTRLRQAVLKWAFDGKLVDQDPTDEPADKLLARIRTDRAADAPIKNGGGRRKGAA